MSIMKVVYDNNGKQKQDHFDTIISISLYIKFNYIVALKIWVKHSTTTSVVLIFKKPN